MASKSHVASPLKPDQLRRTFDPALVPFDTSADAAECKESVLGQTRAKEALEFGLSIQDMNYHVFVAGPQRTGKTHLVRSFVERIAADQAQPPDWAYVHNFREPDKPRALRLVPGGGRVLSREMDALVEGFKLKIPEVFESEDYAHRKEAVLSGFKEKRAEIFQQLDKESREQGYALRFEPTGIVVSPADEEGNPLPEEAIREMAEEDRAELRKKSDHLQKRVSESLRAVGAMEKEVGGAMAALDKELVGSVVDRLMEELFDKYAEHRDVLVYLEQVRENVVENYEGFKKKEQPQMPFPMPIDEPSFQEFKVNVFVDNSETEGAPVVVESNPTHPNLFGRIERQAQFGALVTDFTLLKSGAIHKANGGYLVLPMLDLLRYWLPWEGLKRALVDRKVVMEDVMEQLGYMITRSLRPEPIALDLKVILVGEDRLYYLLYAHDQQFPKLFKVLAQMAESMHWENEEVAQFMDHLCLHCREKDLLPLDRTAVARLVELGAELAGDRERITLQLSLVEDMVKESHFHAKKAGRQIITDEDVNRAVERRRYRSSMYEERMRESITRGFINVETEGAKVGQINGLAVYDLGVHAFGKPSRITATVGLGKGGVVDIEREAKLAGPFHTKGVLILSGFLRGRFAHVGPLALTASLVFEQSYSGVDGDSASMAELLTIMSRLAGAPLRQDLAITGSVSQEGQAQAIGGVNQKVEGFFRVCQARGLTGSQGVAIPKANLKNLMLHPDVVEACRKKQFSVYAVEDVDQALELFTGMKAGARKKDGSFTKNSLNNLVEKELQRMIDTAKDLGKGNGNGK